MAKPPRAKVSSPYKTVGSTYDGVKVLAPKTKSKTFTAAEVRRAIEKALDEVSGGGVQKPLRESDALRVQKLSIRFQLWLLRTFGAGEDESRVTPAA